MGSDKSQATLSTYTFPERVRVDELLIREPTEADVAVIAPAFVDPAIGGEAGLPPVDAETLKTMLREQLPILKGRGLLSPYVIADERDGGRILGGCTLQRFDPMRDTVEVGYWLFLEARGRGVASRVVGALVNNAFERGIFRVEAHVRIGNQPSERVLERAGFTREGIKRRFFRHDGERVDATIFSRLADDE